MNELDILQFGRFKYPQPYTGSHKGMKFRIVHPKAGEGEPDLIHTEVYSGPLCYEKTDKESMIRKDFEYSKEGYEEMLSYLWELYNSRSWE